MKLATALAALVPSALVPSIALGHPGHGSTAPQSWTHYLTEPAHLGALALIAAVAILAERARIRRREPR